MRAILWGITIYLYGFLDSYLKTIWRPKVMRTFSLPDKLCITEVSSLILAPKTAYTDQAIVMAMAQAVAVRKTADAPILAKE